MPGLDSNVKLLLHGNGVDGATTFPDASASAHGNGTATGNVQVDTAQSKFGGASMLFDGSGDRISYADSPDWDFGSSDMAIDCWVRFSNAGANNTVVGRVTNSGSYMYFTFEGGSSLRFRDYTGVNNIDFTRTVSVTTNTWYHVAVTRSGSNFRMFLDGVQQGATYVNANAFTDRSSALDIGAMTENGSYVMNGWIDELRISKGDARWTANFTPPTEEYSDATDASFDATVLDAVADLQAPTINLDSTFDATELDAIADLYAPDGVGDVQVVSVTELDATAEVIAPDLQIDSTVEPSVLSAIADVLSPSFPGISTAPSGTRILSINPLIFVNDRSPAIIVKVDTTDPENLTYESEQIVGLTNAVDASLNETTGYVYVVGANGKMAKIEIADITNQTLIDFSDSDDLLTSETYPDYALSFAGTENNTGELYVVDERETEIMDSRIDVLAELRLYGDMTFNAVEAKILEADCTVLGTVTKVMNCDFKCLTDVLDNIVPIKRTDFHVYLDGVELSNTDVDLATITITHNIGEKSTATFTLTRKHDRLNVDLAGNTRAITNQNEIDIYIQDRLEFSGKIARLNCNYSQNQDNVSVEALGEERTYRFNNVNLSLPGLTERLSPYHVMIQNPQIYNPFINPDDETPVRYKGITVNLGEKRVQSYARFHEFDSFGSDAEAIQNGTFVPRQNWTYFWSPTVTRFGNYNVSASERTPPTGIPFHTFTLPSFNLPVMRISSTNSPFFNLGETSAIFFSYIGTSLAPVSEDLWILTNANHRRQRQYEDIITELGTYSVGTAPYKEISVRNGVFEPKFRWVDEPNGLYSIKDAGYNFINYAKRVADLEYQKLLNINGQIFPETSCTLTLMIDGYFYHDLQLLTRVNIDNTTEAGIYKNNNGFPVSIKGIQIDSSSMKVSLTTDNLKSEIELEALDGLYPDEDDDEFNEPEQRLLQSLKSDMRTRLQVE